MSSAFRKFTASQDKAAPQQQLTRLLPSGCKFNNANLPVTSSGVPSLDLLMADGIPIGTMVGIREDSPTNYWQLLSKLFLSQGLHSDQAVFLPVIGQTTVKTFVAELPGLQAQAQSAQPEVDATQEKLSIAWRYQNMAQLESRSTQSSFCSNFDLTKTVDLTGNPNVYICNESALSYILNSLTDLIKKHFDSRTALGENATRKLLRIFIPSLGSLPWNCNNEREICQFLFKLRALLRYSFAVCYITFPDWIYTNRHIFPFLDCCFTLSTEGPIEKFEFHGFLRVDKCFRVNSFASNALFDTKRFVFKCKKHKFIIEKFHLPPELGDEPARFGAPCSQGNKMDF